jgi:prepilin-type N-terminal cleavage/methylation domain-containing protein
MISDVRQKSVCRRIIPWRASSPSLIPFGYAGKVSRGGRAMSPRKDDHGFTMIEIIAVLVIISIVAAVVISRIGDNDFQFYGQASLLRGHLRYAQTKAMNASPADGVVTWGIKCDGASYWLFRGTNPDDTNNIFLLPDDTANDINGDRKLELSAKKISVTEFTVFFDSRGIPYSSYSSAAVNTPLAGDLSVVVTPAGKSSPTMAINITPFTGFIS